jgi:F-type H+-transporting ATPase subunit epsilon
MANKSFSIQVYTQAEKVYDSDSVTSVVFPAADGQMGVLYNHAPMLSMVGEGDLRIQEGDLEKTFHMSGGFFEVSGNKATILADSFKRV